jgi:hypothetical protein
LQQWLVVFEDYVLVIDGISSAQMKSFRKSRPSRTLNPVRFDTHHHGDHAYGNQVWVENGATPRRTPRIDEMKKHETDITATNLADGKIRQDPPGCRGKQARRDASFERI